MHSTAKFVPEGQKNTNGFVLNVHMEAYPGRGSPTLILALMEEWLKLWAILKKLWRHLRHCYGRQLSKRWDSDNRSVNTLLLTSRNTNNKACLFNRIIPYLFASLSSLVYRKLSGSIAALIILTIEIGTCIADMKVVFWLEVFAFLPQRGSRLQNWLWSLLAKEWCQCGGRAQRPASFGPWDQQE